MTDRNYADWRLNATPGSRELLERIAELRANSSALAAARTAAAKPFLAMSAARRVPTQNGEAASEWVALASADPAEWRALRLKTDEASAAFDSNDRAIRAAQRELDTLMRSGSVDVDTLRRAAAEELLSQGATARRAQDELLASLRRASEAGEYLGIGGLTSLGLQLPQTWSGAVLAVKTAVSKFYFRTSDPSVVIRYGDLYSADREAEVAALARSIK